MPRIMDDVLVGVHITRITGILYYIVRRMLEYSLCALYLPGSRSGRIPRRKWTDSWKEGPTKLILQRTQTGFKVSDWGLDPGPVIKW